jgi:hypothetical protein
VSIPRSKPAESSGALDGLEYYCDHIAIFDTENKDKAQTIAELLTKDYEGGPGEDYPEGFIFKSEAEMSLKERVRAHEQLSNLENGALLMHEKAATYAEKAHMLLLGNTETNEPSSKADNWEQVSIDILDNDTARYKIGKDEWKRVNYEITRNLVLRITVRAYLTNSGEYFGKWLNTMMVDLLGCTHYQTFQKISTESAVYSGNSLEYKSYQSNITKNSVRTMSSLTSSTKRIAKELWNRNIKTITKFRFDPPKKTLLTGINFLNRFQS